MTLVMHSTNSRVRDTVFTRGAGDGDGAGARSGGGNDGDGAGNGLAARVDGDDVDGDDVDDGDDGASKVKASWDFTTDRASPTQTPP
jgi:hypothetical protein